MGQRRLLADWMDLRARGGRASPGVEGKRGGERLPKERARFAAAFRPSYPFSNTFSTGHHLVKLD